MRTNTLAYKKRVYHADMMPFYFHFDLPQGRDKGLLALQRTGTLGIHSVLSGFLTKEIKKQFPDFILALNLAAGSQVIEQYVRKDSALTEIHFLRYELTSDVADKSQDPVRPPRKGALITLSSFAMLAFLLRTQFLDVSEGRDHRKLSLNFSTSLSMLTM